MTERGTTSVSDDVDRPAPNLGGPGELPDVSTARELRRVGGDMLPIVIGLIIVWTYFQLANSNFLSPRNLTNLLVQISSTGIITIGVVLILLIGEIDLSIGSVAGMTSALLALSLVHGLPGGPAL